MEVFSLSVMLLVSSVFGIAVDSYWHPKSIDIEVVDQGSASTGIGNATAAAIVRHQIDRMAKTPSLVARPHIRASNEQGFVNAVGEVTGLMPVIKLMRSAFQSPPDRLTLGIYKEGTRLAIFGTGVTEDLPRRFELFEVGVTQDDGETTADAIKRATVLGISRLDPYLSILHLLGEDASTGDTRYGARALEIIDIAKVFYQGLSGRSPLLARMLNVEGLIHLRHGDLDRAASAFIAGLRHSDQASLEVTRALLRMNRTMVQILRGETEVAAAGLASLLAENDGFGPPFGARIVSSENVVFSLSKEEVEFIRSYSDTLQGALALHQGRPADAEPLLKRALERFPDQIAALSLLADLEAARGNAAAERGYRDAVINRTLARELYHEAAISHMRLVYANGALSVTSDRWPLP